MIDDLQFTDLRFTIFWGNFEISRFLDFDFPDFPVFLEIPVFPDFPDFPEIPDNPDFPEIPEIPDSPDFPEIPDFCYFSAVMDVP